MSHTYKRNYLKQVIFRVDFDPIQLDDFDELEYKLNDSFDISKKLKAIEGNFELKVDSGEILNRTPESHEIWQFTNSSTNNRLEIGPRHCLLEYFKYKNSSTLKNDIENLCETLLSRYKVTNIVRVGLRYLNEIELTKVKKIGDWEKYIEPELIKYIGFLKNKNKIATRMLNQIETKSDNFNVVLKYGIWNNKYPSPITNSSFIIDIDSFSRLPLEYEHGKLVDFVTDLNTEAENIFEMLITSHLRKEMDI